MYLLNLLLFIKKLTVPIDAVIVCWITGSMNFVRTLIKDIGDFLAAVYEELEEVSKRFQSRTLRNEKGQVNNFGRALETIKPISGTLLFCMIV